MDDAEGRGLPEDWRTRFVQMVCGAAELDGSWFGGGPVLDGHAQIEIYREQYGLRIFDAVAEEVPGTCALLGDRAAATVRAYMAEHPPTSWTLNRVADAFVAWLERSGHPEHILDMARLDRAVQAGFEAAAGEAIRPDQLVTTPSLRLQPHVSLLMLRSNVHWIRSASMSNEVPPPLRTGSHPVVVFRRGIKMRHWEVEPGAWSILEGIQDGLDIEGSIERAFARGQLDPESLAADLERWFQDFAERELVSIAEPGPRSG